VSHDPPGAAARPGAARLRQVKKRARSPLQRPFPLFNFRIPLWQTHPQVLLVDILGFFGRDRQIIRFQPFAPALGHLLAERLQQLIALRRRKLRPRILFARDNRRLLRSRRNGRPQRRLLQRVAAVLTVVFLVALLLLLCLLFFVFRTGRRSRAVSPLVQLFDQGGEFLFDLISLNLHRLVVTVIAKLLFDLFHFFG